MDILVVYDSFFGNTEKIGKAIAEILGAKAARIAEIKPEDVKAYDMLIVGSPTRASKPSPNTSVFINGLPNLSGVKVAAFDTRIDAKDIKSPIARVMLGLFISIFGYAAKPMAKKLVEKGGKLVAKPEGFYVLDTEGPLREGEIDRAESWANKIRKGELS